ERTINEVGPGEWIGELALLTQTTRSATVYALRDSELMWLSQEVFDTFVCRDAKALLQTSRSIVGRLQRQLIPAEPQTSTRTRTVALVPVHRDVDMSWFAGQLARCLAGFGSLLHLSSKRVDAELGKADIAQSKLDDPSHFRLSDWLMAQERTFDFVVYQADPS